MEYVVVIEKAPDGSYSAYVPDLPGCVACGDSPEEAATEIGQAVRLHIESLRSHQEPVPQPTARAVTIYAA
ncbi:MAG: type II toxin-antitoxin system HicB family antitoxin [Phycisphaerales bacterium]|nr:type II toxin-antitoxin system HicB family antitoxin [Phycisphaerales bacterium]